MEVFFSNSDILKEEKLRQIFSDINFKKTTLLYSFENISIKSKTIKSKAAYKKIIVLRDPANFISSFMKYHDPNSKIISTVIKIYKEYLRAYKMLKNNFNYIFINYNKFIIDLDYRKNISAKIENHRFQMAEFTMNITTDFGGGSSFSGSNLPKDVFSRWEYYKSNKHFLNYLQDEELTTLSLNFFNQDLPGYKELSLI